MRWLIPLATAIWAVWTWSQDRRQGRLQEDERNSALYINPFLTACEDLQSRIYNIVELQGLDSLRERYPDGSYADETLYLMVRWFGWLAAVLRYGPHIFDQETIRLTDAVRSAFSTLEYPVGPFNFFRPEQKSLGKIIMTRFEGQFGIEQDTISFYQFKDNLEEPPLSESESIKQSLSALRQARDVDSLPGRERLAAVHCHLVDLLNCLESKVGISLFSGERSKCSICSE